jgi:hypothetical protein
MMVICPYTPISGGSHALCLFSAHPGMVGSSGVVAPDRIAANDHPIAILKQEGHPA